MAMDYAHKWLPSTFSTIRHVGVRRALEVARIRAWGANTFFGLVAELEQIPPRPYATTLLMDPVRPASAFEGFETALKDGPADEAAELLARTKLCRGDVATLHVALDEAGRPVYAQWLVSAAEQADAGRLLGATRTLGEGESLVEGAYTFPAARGRGAMRYGMGQLLELARMRGDERVLTYVHEQNVPSLRGCASVGFRIDHVRIDAWRFGHLRRRFEPLTGEHRRRFAEATAPR